MAEYVERPFGVTILAILAGILAVINVIITLRFLGFFPWLGLLDIRIFNLWYALLYGLLAYIWFWVAQMLWQVERQGWIFLLIITTFTLLMSFITMLTGGSWYDNNVAVLLSALILIYIMLPGVRRAFGTD
ncbi:hypothetical protein [Methanoculleus oceani]|uniref:Uncharacterized protein n=1 Tax=Methanoculleus oceani TaxID=2184756 RepID=A0ABD4TAE4_9EURY|nr:hypothetical protein [Methanoculleus sp. CWC-02]MCM2465432.1 hypothetical protein [Methanoculleus sp. CWC-02]